MSVQLKLLEAQLPEALLEPQNAVALRKKHWQAWLNGGVPSRHEELWKYTRLNYLEDEAFQINHETRTAPGEAPLICHDYYSITFVDGILDRDASRLPSEVSIEFSDGTAAAQALDEKHKHAFADLNVSLAQAGYRIEVPAKVALDKPIVITRLFTEARHTSHYVNVLHVGKSASCRIIEYNLSITDEAVFTTSRMTVNLDENASCEWMQYMPRQLALTAIQMLSVKQARNSRFVSRAFDFGAKLSRTELTVALEGEGAMCDLNGLYYATRESAIDYYIQVNHQASHTQSFQTYNGIADDSAKTVFNGGVYVAGGIQGIEAQQSNPNILLSRQATMNTKPELLIYSDEVKCSHGATVGQLDSDALFYLRSRGIKIQDAHAMLLVAFAERLLAALDDDAFKDCFHATITKLSQHDA